MAVLVNPLSFDTWGVPYEDIEFDEGDLVFEKGDVGSGLHLMISGCVCLYVDMGRKPSRTAASRRVLSLCSEGDYFGIKALVESTRPQPHSARAVRKSVVRVFDAVALKERIARMDPLARAVLQHSVRALDEQLQRQADDYMKSVRERVASSLTSLARAYGEPVEGGVLLDLGMSRKEMAQLAGTIDESLTRQLAHFKSEGILESDRKTILIKDLDALSRVSD